MDGTVVSIVTRQGQTLAASQTVPTLLKLANLETMTVKAQISEADVTRVKAGMPVYFTLMGDPDTRYHGTLRTVELAPPTSTSRPPAPRPPATPPSTTTPCSTCPTPITPCGSP